MTNIAIDYYCNGCSNKCKAVIMQDIDLGNEKEGLGNAPKPDSLNCLVNGQIPAWESDDV